jgi:hypothetical protein
MSIYCAEKNINLRCGGGFERLRILFFVVNKSTTLRTVKVIYSSSLFPDKTMFFTGFSNSDSEKYTCNVAELKNNLY